MSKPVIDILGYRDWAHELQRMVENQVGNADVHWHSELKATCGYYTGSKAPVFAVGWSEIIPKDFYASRPVFVLHPSPLPRYAGGSPIQHQIMGGEKTSAVTIFRIVKDEAPVRIDSGPIAWSMPYSLEGDMAEILSRIAMIGSLGVATLIGEAQRVGWDNLPLLPQVTEAVEPRHLQRRRPAESELMPVMISTWSAERLHNFVRMLQDPYPNAYIVTADGGRLYILKTRFEGPPPTPEGAQS